MKRWLLWLLVGVVIFVAGMLLYSPWLPASEFARFVATLALRFYVYVTIIAAAIAVGRWLSRPRGTT